MTYSKLTLLHYKRFPVAIHHFMWFSPKKCRYEISPLLKRGNWRGKLEDRFTIFDSSIKSVFIYLYIILNSIFITECVFFSKITFLLIPHFPIYSNSFDWRQVMKFYMTPLTLSRVYSEYLSFSKTSTNICVAPKTRFIYKTKFIFQKNRKKR